MGGGTVKRRRWQWCAFSRRLCWNGEVRSVSFLGDRCGHGRSYGPSRRRRQLLDLRVQLPDDPLHGFAALDQIRGDVSPSEALKEAAPRRLACTTFLRFLFSFLSAYLSKTVFLLQKKYLHFKPLKNKSVLCVFCVWNLSNESFGICLLIKLNK